MQAPGQSVSRQILIITGLSFSNALKWNDMLKGKLHINRCWKAWVFGLCFFMLLITEEFCIIGINNIFNKIK